MHYYHFRVASPHATAILAKIFTPHSSMLLPAKYLFIAKYIILIFPAGEGGHILILTDYLEFI